MKLNKAGGIGALVVVGLALIAGLALTTGDQTIDAAEEFARAALVIETASGPVRLDVEIARSNEQRARGLMFRTTMDEDSGMIFLYENPRDISMWMKNTILSLDMLFIAENGRISRIVANTTPMSEATIPSRSPIRAVLELVAGAAKRHGIQAGDIVKLDDLEG